MLIAHITDLHIGLDTSSLPTHPGPVRAMERALAHVRGMAPAPDVLLVSGDLTENGRPEDYEQVLETLKKELPSTSEGGPLVLAIPGNHDDRDIATKVLAEFMPVSADAPAGHTCIHVQHGLVHFIGLDTTVCGQAHGELSDVQLAWLEARLAACAEQPVALFMHHPPLVTSITAMDACGLLRGREPLARLVAQHGDVQFIAAGHLHRPIVGSLGGAPVLVAPSSSHQIDLNLVSGAPLACIQEPAMVGLYRYSASEGTVCHFSYVDPMGGPIPI